MLIFDSFRGNELNKQIFKQYIEKDRTNVSFLLIGGEGCGVTTFARMMASTIVSSIKPVQKKVHPDYLEIVFDGKSSRDKINEFITFIHKKPYESPKVVAVLDEIDKIDISVSNSLLKTIEEVPLESVVILTSLTDNILQTISSRAHKIFIDPSFSREDNCAFKELFNSLIVDCSYKKVIDVVNVDFDVVAFLRSSRAIADTASKLRLIHSYENLHMDKKLLVFSFITEWKKFEQN